MKALEKDRNRRYETANGFAADIQRYLAGEAVAGPPAEGGVPLPQVRPQAPRGLHHRRPVRRPAAAGRPRQHLAGGSRRQCRAPRRPSRRRGPRQRPPGRRRPRRGRAERGRAPPSTSTSTSCAATRRWACCGWSGPWAPCRPGSRRSARVHRRQRAGRRPGVRAAPAAHHARRGPGDLAPGLRPRSHDPAHPERGRGRLPVGHPDRPAHRDAPRGGRAR